MEIKNHFGVYGVCFENGKLLCVEKTRGPYQHRYDLPGASQELGEGLTETLIREILEETGYTISDYSNPRIYDVLVQEDGQDLAVHHIMSFYDIEINEEEPQVMISEAVSDDDNDSHGYIWMDIQEITEENASPLVLKAKAELLGFPELDMTNYRNWKAKMGDNGTI